MISLPKISMIIPVYNIEEYLAFCLDSILDQEYDDYEIILVDDGSPDGSPAICDEYARKDSRISVIHKQNGGPSSARNAGLEKASGEFIWFIDGDDYLPAGALLIVLKYLDKGADIINFGFMNHNGELQEDDKCRFPFTGCADAEKTAEFVADSFSKLLFTFAWRNLYRADFLQKNGLRFAEELNIGEDAVFNSEAFLKAGSIYFADEYIYVYRYRTEGLSKYRGKEFDMSYAERVALYNKLRDENYQKYCRFPSENYYINAGRFVLYQSFNFSILPRLYKSASKNKFRLFKTIAKSEMIRTAFERYDVGKTEDRGFDRLMLRAVRHKLYLIGHLICKYILYK